MLSMSLTKVLAIKIKNVLLILKVMIIVMFLVMMVMMMSELLPCRSLFRGNYGKDKQLPPQMTSTTLLTFSGRKSKK